MAVQVRSRRPVVFINGTSATLGAGGDSEAKEGIPFGGKADDREVTQGEERDDGAGFVPAAQNTSNS